MNIFLYLLYTKQCFQINSFFSKKSSELGFLSLLLQAWNTPQVCEQCSRKSFVRGLKDLCKPFNARLQLGGDQSVEGNIL